MNNQYFKIYYSKHKKKFQTQRKRYYQKNKMKINQQTKTYYFHNKEKMRNLELLRKFNITSKIYNNLFKKQSGKCAICKQPEPIFDNRTNKKRLLSVDHNHKTGEVRGLLCTNCNNGLGRFRDKIKFLNNAINYLKKGSNKNV